MPQEPHTLNPAAPNGGARPAARSTALDGARHLEHIADAMPVLISYCDRDLTYRFCNASYTEWFGLGMDELVGRTIHEVLGQGAFDTVAPAIQRVLTGERVGFDARLPYLHGGSRDVRVEYIPHTADDGETLGFYAMIVDISERLRAQMPQAWLAAIVEHSHDAIIGKDLDGRITSWNAAAERMYGYRAEEIVGQSILRIFPQDRRDEMEDILAHIRRGEAVRAMRTIRVRKDGVPIEVLVSVSPVRDHDGQLLGASAIAHDLSGFKRAELAMRESEERLKVATEASEIGIFDWDVASDTIRWDERVRSIWGVAEDEEINYGRFLHGIVPEDRKTLQAAIDRSLDPQGDGKYYAEYRVVHPHDGRTRHIAATGQVSFEEQRPVRMVGTVQDISDRKQVERQKEEWAERLAAQLQRTRKAEDDLRRSNHDLKEFAGIVTHDLRNPLGSAIFTAELMRETLQEGDIEGLGQQVELLTESLQNMNRLVKELHDLALSRSSERELRDLDLEEPIEEARRSVSLVLGKHGGDLTVEGPMPQVRGNPTLLTQLFSNLIDNAVKYRGPQPPLIRIHSGKASDRQLVFVSDNGCGIPPDECERVFQSQERGSNVGTIEGSGLGLAYCRQIMESHGGSIAVAESTASGTTFELRFPTE